MRLAWWEAFKGKTLGVVAVVEFLSIGCPREHAFIPCLGGCGALNSGWQWPPYYS